MRIRNYQTTEMKENPHHVDVRSLYEQENAEAVHITLQDNEALKPHVTPVDAFFYIIEGNPTVHIGEETKQVKPDDLIESPANIMHFISNHSGKKARILVVKAPRQKKKTKIL